MRNLSNIFIISSLSCLMLVSCAKDITPKAPIATYEVPESMRPVAASMQERFAVRLELVKRYINAKQFDLAIKYTDEILKEQNDHVEALHLKAISLMGLQNYNEADKYFKQALEKDKNIDVLNNYGWLLCKQGNELGLQYLAQAEPQANAIIYPKILANQGVCYLYKKDYEKAAALLKKSLTISPNYIPASVYLAYIYAKQNNTLAAENILNDIGVARISDPELLWLGINVFKISGNTISVKLWGNYLVSEFPNSQEVIKYHRNLVE